MVLTAEYDRRGSFFALMVGASLDLSGGTVTREELLERISVDPNVCFGRPCIRGTRLWVSLILDLLASGMREVDVIDEYPQLARQDIRAAIHYGVEMGRESYV